MLKNIFKRIVGEPTLGAIVAVVILFSFFSLANPTFFTFRSLGGMMVLVGEMGIVVIGVGILMVSGEFDLSIGANFALTPFIWIWSVNNLGLPLLAGIVLALSVSILIGLINSQIRLRTGLHSFIVTLGTMYLLRGILLAITAGFPMHFSTEGGLFTVLNGVLIGTFRSSFFWFLGLILLGFIILRKTKYGNWCFASGANPNVARGMGVPVKRVKTLNFMMVGFLAGFAGCVNFARLGVVHPTLGMGWELYAIAACVIGGTALMGGIGTAIGAGLGAFVLGSARWGLIMAGASPYWYQAFVGAILIIAAVVNITLIEKIIKRHT